MSSVGGELERIQDRVGDGTAVVSKLKLVEGVCRRKRGQGVGKGSSMIVASVGGIHCSNCCVQGLGFRLSRGHDFQTRPVAVKERKRECEARRKARDSA